MTPERARELMRLAMGFVQVLNPEHSIAPETEGERKLVKEVWDRNPEGGSSYYSTLCDIANGRTKT